MIVQGHSLDKVAERITRLVGNTPTFRNKTSMVYVPIKKIITPHGYYHDGFEWIRNTKSGIYLAKATEVMGVEGLRDHIDPIMITVNGDTGAWIDKEWVKFRTIDIGHAKMLANGSNYIHNEGFEIYSWHKNSERICKQIMKNL